MVRLCLTKVYAVGASYIHSVYIMTLLRPAVRIVILYDMVFKILIGSQLLQVWPDSKRLLCPFHVGQAVWRWLRDTHHGVSVHERKELIHFFMTLLYSRTQHGLMNRYSSLLVSVLLFLFSTYELLRGWMEPHSVGAIIERS